MACFSTLGHARNGRAAETDLLSAIHDDGKGFVGIHSATITFTGWPKYGEMIGAGILMSIPGQRLMPPSCRRRCLPGDEAMASIFVLKDEIYQIRNFSRDKVRVLMRLDANKVDLTNRRVHRKDRDFAVTWTRMYGKGRVFTRRSGTPGGTRISEMQAM